MRRQDVVIEAINFLLEREARTTHDSVAENKARSLSKQINERYGDNDESANPLTYLPHQEGPVAADAPEPAEEEESDEPTEPRGPASNWSAGPSAPPAEPPVTPENTPAGDRGAA